MATIIANYRLAPNAPWPAGAEDVRDVASWAQDRAGELDAQSDRICIFGQSAGATHVACHLWDARFKLDTPPRAVVLASGLYRLEPGKIPPNVAAYFGDNPDLYEDQTPYSHADGSRCPTMLSLAEFDPSSLAAPTLELANRLCRSDGRPPRVEWMEGDNHVSTVLAIGTPHDNMGPLVSDFMISALNDPAQ